MNLTVFRKRDIQSFVGVKSFTVIRRGFILTHIYVDIKFGENASTVYTDKEGGTTSWDIDHKQSPGLGIDCCDKIEVFGEE